MFHSLRAVFIGDFYNIETIVLAAKNLLLENPIKVEIRELFVRSKAILDLYILKESPKFLGKKEYLGYLN